MASSGTASPIEVAPEALVPSGSRRATAVLSATWLPVLAPTSLVAVLSLAVMIGWRFDGLYGQDPFAYFSYSVGPLRHTILAGAGFAPMFWPLGYPVAVAFASIILGASTVAGQAVSLASATTAVILTYMLGREIFLWSGFSLERARRAALGGAFLLAAAGWTLEASVMIMPDGLTMAASLLSAWALVRWCRHRTAGPGWLSLAGAALAWAAISRWGQLILIPVWLIVLIPSVRADRARFLRALPLLTAPAAVIIGAQLWLAFVVPPGPGLGRWPFLGDLGLVHGSGGGWSPLHLFQRSFSTIDGSLRYALPNAVYYATAPFLPKNLTPLALPAVVLGAWQVVKHAGRAAVLLLAWPSAVLLLDAGLAEQNVRFVLQALPPLALLGGLGLAVLGDTLIRFWRVAPAALLAAVVPLVAGSGLYDMHKVIAASLTDRETAQWAAGLIPPRAVTAAFEITATLDYATGLHPFDLSQVSARELRRDGKSRPVYVLVRVRDLGGQFARVPPGPTFRALQRTPGLAAVGRKNGYTLFRLGRR